jgi:hypothetical protein
MADTSQQALLNRQSELVNAIKSARVGQSRKLVSELNEIQRQLRSKYNYDYSEQPNFNFSRGNLKAEKSDFGESSFQNAPTEGSYLTEEERRTGYKIEPTKGGSFSAGSGQLNTTNATSLGSTPVTSQLRPETAFETARRLSEYEQNLAKRGFSDADRLAEVERLKQFKDVRIDPQTGLAYGIIKGGFERLPDTAQLQEQNVLAKKIESGTIKPSDLIPEGKQVAFIYTDEKGNIIKDAGKDNLEALKSIAMASESKRNELLLSRRTDRVSSTNLTSNLVGQESLRPSTVSQETTRIDLTLPQSSSALDVQSAEFKNEDYKKQIPALQPISFLLGSGEKSIQKRVDEQSLTQSRDSLSFNNPLFGAESFALGLASVGIKTVKAILNPIDTAKATFTALSTPVESIVKPVISIPNKILTGTPAESGFITGQVVGEVVVAELGGRLQTSIKNVAKDIFVSTGAKEIPLSQIESPQVTAGERFPTATSVQESLQRFEKAKTPQGTFEVVTASPSKIAGDTVGAGSKGSAGIEDVGLYVTPRGEASTYFTGLKVQPEGGYSLNPLKGIADTPSITTFEVRRVTQYPRGVIQKAGFEPVNLFQEQVLAPKGVAVITKRSELGLGNVQRQTFTAPRDFVEGNFNIKAGEKRVEAGTSEL